MNWTQEPDRHRLALLDRLVHANRALWEGNSLQLQLRRTTALCAALDAGCELEQVASALGVHVTEVEALAAAGRRDRLPAGHLLG
jgi:hypothetical protein